MDCVAYREVKLLEHAMKIDSGESAGEQNKRIGYDRS